MRVVDFSIPRLRWRVRAYFAVSKYNVEEIVGDLIYIRCPYYILRDVEYNLRFQKIDTGFTYSNRRRRQTVMVVGLTSHPSEFLNSYEHELRHLVDDVAGTTGIPLSGEDVAYLTGNINRLLWEDIHGFVCCCPRS